MSFKLCCVCFSFCHSIIISMSLQKYKLIQSKTVTLTLSAGFVEAFPTGKSWMAIISNCDLIYCILRTYKPTHYPFINTLIHDAYIHAQIQYKHTFSWILSLSLSLSLPRVLETLGRSAFHSNGTWIFYRQHEERTHLVILMSTESGGVRCGMHYM